VRGNPGDLGIHRECVDWTRPSAADHRRPRRSRDLGSETPSGAPVTSPATSTDVAANLARVRERIANACQRAGRDPSEVTLIAVTKTWPAEAVLEAIAAGVTDLGENRVQDALPKVAELDLATRDAQLPVPTWHFIGHLQTNK